MDIIVPNADGFVRESGGRLLVPGRYRAAGLARPGRMKRSFHFWCGQGSLVYPDGTVELCDPEPVPNAVADEGEANLINVYLKENAASSKYLFLINDSGLAETDTVASITSESETPGTDGYNRAQIASGDWGANSLDSGDYQSTAAEKTFGPNTSTAWSLTHVGMTTASTGTGGLFLAYLATSTTTVGTSVSYKYTLTWKFQ